MHLTGGLLKGVSYKAKLEDVDESRAIRQFIGLGVMWYVVDLYKKGKITLGEAAELSGVSLRRMLDILAEHGVKGNVIDRDYIKDKELFGLPVVPFEEIEESYPPDKFKMFVAMGYSNVNKARAEKYYEAKSKGYELISYVNSKSVLWGDTKIGDNCFIFENQTIQPVVKIGNDVII